MDLSGQQSPLDRRCSNIGQRSTGDCRDRGPEDMAGRLDEIVQRWSSRPDFDGRTCSDCGERSFPSRSPQRDRLERESRPDQEQSTAVEAQTHEKRQQLNERYLGK